VGKTIAWPEYPCFFFYHSDLGMDTQPSPGKSCAFGMDSEASPSSQEDSEDFRNDSQSSSGGVSDFGMDSEASKVPLEVTGSLYDFGLDSQPLSDGTSDFGMDSEVPPSSHEDADGSFTDSESSSGKVDDFGMDSDASSLSQEASQEKAGRLHSVIDSEPHPEGFSDFGLDADVSSQSPSSDSEDKRIGSKLYEPISPSHSGGGRHAKKRGKHTAFYSFLSRLLLLECSLEMGRARTITHGRCGGLLLAFGGPARIAHGRIAFFSFKQLRHSTQLRPLYLSRYILQAAM